VLVGQSQAQEEVAFSFLFFKTGTFKISIRWV